MTTPLYIPSKGRAQSRYTVKALERQGREYFVVIEKQEWNAYAAVIDKKRLLVLDEKYKRDYELCDDLGMTKSTGAGPARNFAWDHALSLGARWHWVMDDNIAGFYRYNRNIRLRCDTPVMWQAMEDFCERYTNVLTAGPNYMMFVPRKRKFPPFIANTRIYSCNLIRNDSPFRWRCRYNEDTDLSLRILKAGMCTIQFNAFLQNKVRTSALAGGNTAEFYSKEGTAPKSAMLVKLHPDVARLTFRWGRLHHYVDYAPFEKNKLLLRDDLPPLPMRNEYGMEIIER